MITFILGCAPRKFYRLSGRADVKRNVRFEREIPLVMPAVMCWEYWIWYRFFTAVPAGRCRYCGAKIPAEAFWTELVSGIACCLIMYRYDVSVLALRGILLWMVLLCLTLTDLHAWIIPHRLQIAGILIFSARRWAYRNREDRCCREF